MKPSIIYRPRLTNKNIKLIKLPHTKKNIKVNINNIKKHIYNIKSGDNIVHYVSIFPNKILIKDNSNTLIKTVKDFKEVILSHHSFENYRNVEALLNGIVKYRTKYNNNNNNNSKQKGLLGLKFEECIILKQGTSKLITWNIERKLLDNQNIVLILEKKTSKGYKYIYINNEIKEFYFPERIVFISLGTNNAYNYPYMLSKSYFINLEFIYVDNLLNTYWAIKDCNSLESNKIYPTKTITKIHKPLGLLGLDVFKYESSKTIIDSSKVKKLF